MTGFLAGHLSIGLQSEYIPGGVILRHLPLFRRNFPQVTIAFRYCPLDQIESELIAGGLDFALVSRVETPDFLTIVECGAISYAPVVAKEYLDQRRPLTTVDEVLASDLIDVAPHLPLWRHWLGKEAAKWETLLQSTSSVCIVPNFHAALELTIASGGIACLPKNLVESHASAAKLIDLSSVQAAEPKKLLLAYRKKNSRNLIESVFLEHLLDNRPFT